MNSKRTLPQQSSQQTETSNTLEDHRDKPEVYEVIKRLIRLKEVEVRIGLSRSQIYALMAIGEFPGSVSIGQRARAWVESDIDDWIRQKVESSRTDCGGAR